MFNDLQSTKGPQLAQSYEQRKFMAKHYSTKATATNHSAVMNLILKAKNAGDHFADSALAELENMTGETFRFVEFISPNAKHFELVRES